MEVLSTFLVDSSPLLKIKEATMKIERSTEIKIQLAEAMRLRANLIDYLYKCLHSQGIKKGEVQNPFLQTIEFSAEGFAPNLTWTAVANLDRTCSMFAGPFYTSSRHPIPVTSDRMLAPVVQLDLKEITELSGFQLGDGLLQLWCDMELMNTNRGLVRVIPRDEVIAAEMTDFDFVSSLSVDDIAPMPEELTYNKEDDEVRVISGCTSVGLQCQTSYLLGVYSDEIPEEVLAPILKDIERFQEITEVESNLHLMGSFYPIQYSAVDVGGFCLINFPGWGSSGNAQIIFQMYDDGDMSFSFEESFR
jgi:hypothetical protein